MSVSVGRSTIGARSSGCPGRCKVFGVGWLATCCDKEIGSDPPPSAGRPRTPGEKRARGCCDDPAGNSRFFFKLSFPPRLDDGREGGVFSSMPFAGPRQRGPVDKNWCAPPRWYGHLLPKLRRPYRQKVYRFETTNCTDFAWFANPV